LQVNLESATSPSYAAITALAFNATNRPEMLAYFWTPDYNDPADYAVPSSSFGFAGGYDNSTVESLGAQALSTQNQVLRAQLYSQITGIVAHDSPMVWTYQYVGYAVYTSKVNGLIYNSLLDGYGFEWQTVWLSP
jgi:ABC-type transport system substrate-binding protein